MKFDRRHFMATGLVAGAASLVPRTACADAAFAPTPGGWRTFDVTTRLDILSPKGASQAWIPLASFDALHSAIPEISFSTLGTSRRL